MAGRIRSRLELRRQAEAAELRGPREAEKVDTTRGGGARKTTSRAKKGGVVRARWGVFDGAMKQVACFDFNQRALADQKVTELNELRKGTYFVQMVKEEVSEGGDDE